MKSSSLLLFACLIVASSAAAHLVPENGKTRLDHHRRPQERLHLQIPDLPGYVTLKVDLHMHTVFSDGHVWPGIRVQEAWQEGLDAIAITDHIEYQPHRHDLPTNHNRSYEIASEAAREADILLIRGSEITRGTPPGHFNAVFIQDASGFLEANEKGRLDLDKEAIDRAAAQNAFIFWNHPGWKVTSQPDSYTWLPFLEDLHSEGKLHGIEVINGFTLHNRALDWCLDKGLTVMGTSDIHNLIEHDYAVDKGVRRSMTLVFAQNRTAEALRDALENRRTVAWSTEILAGEEKWIRALFDAAVTLHDAHFIADNGDIRATIENASDLFFHLERADAVDGWPERVHLNPRSSQIIEVDAAATGTEVRYTATNAYIRSDRHLEVTLKLD